MRSGTRHDVDGRYLLGKINRNVVHYIPANFNNDVFEEMLMQNISFNTLYFMADDCDNWYTIDEYGDKLVSAFASLDSESVEGSRLYNAACDIKVVIFAFYPKIELDRVLKLVRSL